MTLARVLDVCDATAAVIRAAWVASGDPPGADDGVERAYGPTIGLTRDQTDSLLAGRRVYVFPGAWVVPASVDRGHLYRVHTVAVLVVERYTAAAGAPPDTWMDERVRFVEQQVFNPLRDPGLVLTGAVVAEAHPDPDAPAAVDVVYDDEVYRRYRAFWSQATFTFFELTDLTGGD